MRRIALFTLVLLLGLTLLWRGLELYRDYLARLSRGPAPPAAASGAAPPVSPPVVPASPAPLPEATPEELAGLQSPDFETRLKAGWTLRERRVTEAYRSAVEQATSRPENEGMGSLLTCLRARFPGSEALEAALRWLPEEERAYRSNVDPGIVCVLGVIGERADEAPERIRDVLLRGAFGSATVRSVVEKGLERIDLPELPDFLVQRARSDPSDHRRMFALEAAIALGAGELDLALLEHALSEPYHGAQRAARRALADSPLPSAARLIARRLLDEPENRERLGLFQSREQSQHDASAALVEVALDETAPLVRRQAALSILGTQGDPGAAPLLEPLRSGAEPLRSYAAAAIDQLERTRKNGRVAQLRRLGP